MTRGRRDEEVTEIRRENERALASVASLARQMQSELEQLAEVLEDELGLERGGTERTR